MNKLLKASLLILFLLILVASPTSRVPVPRLTQNAYSQDREDSYRLREDEFDPRREGIKDQRIRPVTSDKIVLLSALIHTVLPQETPMPEVIQLGFYTEHKTPASVEIFCEPELYYVDPTCEEWGPGIATFKWPTEIMRRYDIAPHELCARATTIEHAERTMFPACLYYADPPDTVAEYRFALTPLRAMQLQYWILDPETEDLIVTGAKQSIGKNRRLLITWNGLNDSGDEVPDGEYVLKLRGTYKPPFGKSRTASVNYRFYHKARLW